MSASSSSSSSYLSNIIQNKKINYLNSNNYSGAVVDNETAGDNNDQDVYAFLSP
ncbi:hypothetical protein DERF_015981 [Dermatophagoides farinae]|uniref:Uncharacterized protein n=1 Tax=Dermatophagoides farinae TaxID=6954 RepID=A0A922HN45_DERFA|nr:hypothetical protein DERF_015981 [Dermatophagoides farinae]